MSDSISPLGLQNVNNVLKAPFVEYVGPPSELLQLLIDQSSGKKAAILDNAQDTSDNSGDVVRGNAPAGEPVDEQLQWICHGRGLHPSLGVRSDKSGMNVVDFTQALARGDRTSRTARTFA